MVVEVIRVILAHGQICMVYKHLIRRLIIPVDEVLVVHKLDPSDHLIGQHEHSLHGEPAGAEVEEVLEARPQQVHHQHVVVSLLPIPPDVWNTDATLKRQLCEFISNVNKVIILDLKFCK